MRSLFLICTMLLLTFSVRAQSDDPLFARSRTNVVVSSRTQQFFVYGVQSLQPTRLQSLPIGQGQFFWSRPMQTTNEVERIRLVPSLAAVSCERIKEELLNEFGLKDAGGRRIHIQLNDRISEREIGIGATKFRNNWVYGVELPTDLSTDAFVTTIAQVLLVEMANHNASEAQAELPVWLLTGMAAHLRSSTETTSLTLQPNWQMRREQNKIDPVAALRERFQHEMPLTFDELSWPSSLSKDKQAVYRESAHLFVFELLQLKEGRQCMRNFVVQLSQHKNWQFAFLEAFKPHFAKLVDVEKWWALKFTAFAGRDPSLFWSKEESWKQLKAALDVPVQIHLKSDRMPVSAQLTLQEVIQTWEPARQEMALQKATQQLQVARMRVQPEMVRIIDDYRRTIETYLAQKARIGRSSKHGEPPVNGTVLKKSTVSQLDSLDDRRSKLRQMLLSSGN